SRHSPHGFSTESPASKDVLFSALPCSVCPRGEIRLVNTPRTDDMRGATDPGRAGLRSPEEAPSHGLQQPGVLKWARPWATGCASASGWHGIGGPARRL